MKPSNLQYKIDQEILLELTESYLKNLIFEVSNSLNADLDSFAPFMELGIDSFHVLKIVKKLEDDFGFLPKTLLFEKFNINDLALYFMSKHDQTLLAKFADRLHKPGTLAPSGDRHLKPVEAVPVPETAVNASQSSAEGKQADTQVPIVILERKALAHPELGALIQDLFNRYKNEGSASRGTRNIAPNIFIGSEKRGYFNYGRSGNIILVYSYTGPHDYFPVIAREIYQYCADRNFELNIFSVDQIEAVGEILFSATPFGIVSRVVDLKDFTLQGNKMRRLRYQVSKYEGNGTCKTEEYRCGSNKETDQNIAQIIDQWCAARTMVNPLIHIVREEILAGTLSPEHRLFLTYCNEVLHNAILISSLSAEENGYLMDLEFYPPDMPLGGLEFAIVKIIETLVAEGYGLLSLGGTYGCKLAPSSNADPEVDKILETLREQNIFNDEGNLQFKNKFRPESISVFLCRAVGKSNPDNVTDIIMMIADPSRMQTSDEENHNSLEALHQAVPGEETERYEARATSKEMKAPEAVQGTDQAKVMIEGEKRSLVLAEFGYNPLNIPHNQVEHDLKTDSWAQLEMPSIEKQMRQLHADLQQSANIDESLREVFPFAYFALTTSGRTAENVFCKAWSKKGIVLQNLLFPTTIFHQIDKGFTPREIPHPEVFQVHSEELCKGNLDWEALQKEVEQHAASLAFVCIEVNDNAAGGYPVSLEHLKKVKNLLSHYGVPLVMDGTRILENARLIIEHEQGYAEKTIWEVAREIFSCADAVIASLTKDFCVSKGGVIATNDVTLFTKLQDLIQEEGSGLDVIDKKILALALQNRKKIETQVLQRMEGVRSLWNVLRKHDIPVVTPSGGHCILIDVKQIPEFRQFTHPVASFVAWMFLNTGIRAGAHNAGMQKNTSINELVRLAIPVGLKRGEIEEITDKLIRLFERKVNIPEIAGSDAFGDIHANFKLIKYHNASGRVVAPASGPVASPAVPEKAPPVAATIPGKREVEAQQVITVRKSPESKDIAIVGMAGRYPKAKNLNELWDNLLQGRDCLEVIPDSRFEKRRQNGFTGKYRGGFLDDVDKFDSLFFSISPREAEMLDPQERLFLEVAWEVIEDAGYYPEILARENAPRDIGVFVGAVWAMYQMLGVEEKLAGNQTYPNSFFWSIANRVSYWMNLSGPSLTLDTACSSSLTALYLACEAINNGECSGAIVGGVNLDLHQSKYDINFVGGALSKDGVCRTFGKGANGYVAGEGVGALFLKPLHQAIQDGDNIHGVIKSATVNHGGRTSGYTVPNPHAQTSLIVAALNKANIDARSIGYIEAHGTGTELGDPIEISSLNNAFETYKVRKQSCPIGSVKTNIGHLEAAAGVVGISKVLLQMKHRRIVPSLHSAELNEFIDFENSPFYVEQGIETWNEKEVDGARFPRRAGISSFGAGGANAHIIVESYEPPAPSAEETARPAELFFPLSARTEDQLREMALRLRNHIQQDLSGDAAASLNINDIAYTLQLGRKSFDYRLAILAGTKEELRERLTRFIEGKKDQHILTGHVQNAQGITRLLNQREKKEFINLLSQSRDPQKLVQLWIDGLLTDWQGFQAGKTGRRISLPTYPFADKRHWVSSTPKAAGHFLAAPGIHPLIDANESTFEHQLFVKTFHDREFFIHDHIVSNIPTLPGVAYLDLARKAGEIAAGRPVRKIRNILWISPLTVQNSKPTKALIELKPSGDSVQFEVFGEEENGKKQLYSQGKILYATSQEVEAEPEFIDIESIRARCTKVIDGKDAYRLFASFGLNYGPSFQVLQEVYRNGDEVLGALKIPEVRNGDLQDFLLHPSLLDGSLQVGVAAQLGEKSGEMVVPYSIGEVEILHPLPANCFSYVTEAKDDNKANSKLSRKNVVILDEKGKVLVKIRESIGVPLTDVHEKPVHTRDEEEFPKLYYSHVWEKAPIDKEIISQGSLDSLVLFATDETLRNLYQERLGTAGGSNRVVLVMPGNGFEDLGQQTYRINPQDSGDYVRLFEALGQQQGNIENICYSWSVPHFIHSEDFLKEALEKGVYSFLYLCQSLIAQKLDGKIKLLYLYTGKKGDPQPHNDAINGFAKSLQIEHPRLYCKILEIQQEKTGLDEVLNALLAEFHPGTRDAMTVRYEDRERFVRKLEKVEPEEIADRSLPESFGLKENGVYVITGGAGGLGLIFSEFLAKRYKARLVLTGRSELSPEGRAKIEELREAGAEVVYVAADVSRQEDVGNLVQESKSQFGGINGIIHCAGVLRDSFIRNKTAEEMGAVFAPKLYGTLYLDEATQQENLDFFATFSSLAAVGGNAGQCDYSYANHFMDSFAFRRENLRAKGERSGKSISYNWSLWADGGMKLDEQTELLFKKSLGIKPISIETGVDAFTRGLTAKQSQLAVLEGVQEKIERAWGVKNTEPPEPASPAVAGPAAATPPVAHKADGELAGLVENELSQTVMEFLKLDADDLAQDKILLDLGFDSIGLTAFANAINEKYKSDITPVLFFEYPSIKEIAKYLSVEQKDNVLRYHQAAGAPAPAGAAPETAQPASAAARVESLPETAFEIRKGWHFPASAQQESSLSTGAVFSAEHRFVNEPIAIVGIGGVMPQSEDLEEFWDNLVNAKNMVTLVPKDRWNWEDYDGDPFKEKNKSNSKWGGFMKEVDKFDPLFFGISPREAEMMDPQQRIFLETVWKAIEDSGHKVSDLSDTRTGLFVGASAKDYIDVLANSQIVLDGYSASGNSHSILANRVSFLLNLRGPSAPLDTACSSSLVALHRAIESIHTGSCDMAIVGGVQAILSPGAYITLSSAGMLSDDGKCKTFDKRANGYVRGEGSGAIFIKPLSRAEADGNHIYAIIKATAENHGGKVTTLTAPNPNAQYELLMEAYGKAQVDPATVGYIECHGTGTSLGDPIEIQALKKSFSELYKKHDKAPAETPHCGLSSVKTNIGHLEPAAGIASILKVLLAMKHKQIPASLHFEEINPYIDLSGSPFYIVDKTRPWETMRGEDGTPLPRRAGISSFGWGGANAHIVVEEYVPPKRQSSNQVHQGQYIIVLSAKNEDRLKAYVRSMLAHIEKYDIDLAGFAYTLQAGRDEMPERLAVVVPTTTVLKQKFTDFLHNKKNTENLFRNNTRNKKDKFQSMIEGAAGKIFLQALVDQKDVAKLAELWVSGVEIDWPSLYGTVLPRRVSLPAYPFARERYWVPVPERTKTIPGSEGEQRNEAFVSRIYYHGIWQESALQQRESLPLGNFVIFDTTEDVCNQLKERLESLLPAAPRISLVKPGAAYRELEDNVYEINPERPEDYRELFNSLLMRDLLPENILHLWAEPDFAADRNSLRASLGKGVFSLLYLTQALMQASKEREKPQDGQGRRKKTKLLYLYPGHPQHIQPHHAAVSGFARSVAIENSSFVYKTIELRDTDSEAPAGPARILDCVMTELQEEAAAGVEICYQDGKRLVKKIEEATLAPATETSLKEKGVYIITGGLGGLGLVFAGYLARQSRARLVLTGRSALRPKQQKKINELESLGSEVAYYETDVFDREAVARLIADVKSRFTEINGIIHSAGVLRDSVVSRKTAEEMEAVFAAKIHGTVNLDEATKDENLDFFVLFSSLSAVTGNAGQSDYAYANSFMDHFAELRNQFVTKQKRSGKTLSFNWPLWREGGMHLDKQMEALLEKTKGIRVLETATGLDAFAQGLAHDRHQILVMEGNRQKLRRTLGIPDKSGADDKAGHGQEGNRERIDDQELFALLQKDLVQLVIKILRIKEEIFSHDVDMNEYGFDSISLTQFFGELSERYSLDLSPAIFFEYPTFSALSRFLFEEYKDGLTKYFQDELEKTLPQKEATSPQGAPSLIFGIADSNSAAQEEFASGKSSSGASFDILIPVQTEGDRLPIFAMPGAGGGVLSLRQLSLALGNEQPFYGLQAVGFDGKTSPLERVEETAKINIAAMKTVQAMGPYTLLGYSNGGVVAYEMVRMLLEEDETIASLILMESLCPIVRVTDVIEEIADVSNNIMKAMGSELNLDVEQLKQVPEGKRCEYLYEIMTAHGLQLSKDQFTTSYNVSTASDRSCRIYRPVKLSQEIDASLYRASEGYPDMPEDYGWNHLFLNPVRVYTIEANHFSIIEKDPIQEVAKEITRSVMKNPS